MNKKFFSKFAVLTLVVGIFGYLVPTVLAAAPAGTMTGSVFSVNTGETKAFTNTITVADSGAEIKATTDIRIKIKSTTNATWDPTDTTATIGGTASGKVSTTVSYAGSNKILILDVTSDFTTGQTVTISDLHIIGGSTSSVAQPLQWAVDGSIYADGNANTGITVAKIISTSTDVGNNVPTFTSVTDNGSAAGTPTMAGQNVTFSAAVHDDNKDGVYLAVCKTNAITEGSGSAAPTCPGGAWAISTLASSNGSGNSTPSVTYLAAYGDGSQNWYAFACDDNAAATSCSSMLNTDSPFVVSDHVPTLGTVSDFTGAGAVLSDGTNPTNEGTVVTFKGTADDAANDTYYLIVCKTAFVKPMSNAAPQCCSDAGRLTCSNTPGDTYTWALSTETTHNTEASATASTTGDSNQTETWHAYACDKNTVSGGGKCSSDSNTNSPFNINHRPVIGTVTAGPSYGSNASVDPGNGTGGQVFFQIGVTDPDTDTTQDTIDYYICNAATTAFDPTGAGGIFCTNGTLIGSGTGITTSTNAQNNTNTLVPIPTAHNAAITTKIYLRDSHHFADVGSSNTKTYAVTDVNPAVDSYTISDISPSAGSSVNTSFSVTVHDNNGNNDITSVDGLIYDSGASLNVTTGDCPGSVTNEKNCYRRPTCTLGSQSGTIATLTLSCDAITTWYNINPTGGGTVWKAKARVADQNGNRVGADSNAFTVDTLSAVAISESSIGYSAVTPGNASTAQPTTTQNAGNIVIDVGINGTDMTSGGNTIVAAQQHWTNQSSWTWGTGDYALITGTVTSTGTESQGCSNTSNPVRTDHTSGVGSDVVRYWKIFIPANTPTGSYTGVNTFTSIANTCTGTN